MPHGWSCHPFFLFFWGGGMVQSWLLGVCGTNEYTNAQVGDAGGLFESLDPALHGAVPAHPSTSSSVPVPVYLPHPVAVYFVHCSSSSLLHPRTSPVWGFFQSSVYLQCSFTWTGSFAWAPLLQGLIFIGISLLQGLIFIGISLLQGLIFIHCSP